MWQGPHTFIFAWVLNCMLMMVMLFITESFEPKLDSSYFTLKNWELQGRVYEYMGVGYFRKLLVLVGWEKLNKPKNPVNKNLESLKSLEYKTRQSEFGHFVIGIVVLMVYIDVAVRYGFMDSIWLLVLNILLNIYPILVQRYNRPRLRRLIQQKAYAPEAGY